MTGLGFQTNPPAGSSLYLPRSMYQMPSLHGQVRVGNGDHGQALALEADALAGDLAEVGIDAHAGVQLGAERVGHEDRVPGGIEIGIVGPRRHVGIAGGVGGRSIPEVPGEARRDQQRRLLQWLEGRHRQGEGGLEVDVVDAQLARAAAVAGEPVIVHRHVVQEAVGRGQHGRQGERAGRRRACCGAL